MAGAPIAPPDPVDAPAAARTPLRRLHLGRADDPLHQGGRPGRRPRQPQGRSRPAPRRDPGRARTAPRRRPGRHDAVRRAASTRRCGLPRRGRRRCRRARRDRRRRHRQPRACRPSPAPGSAFGAIPAGTGNDFAREIGLPIDPLAAADVIVAALRVRPPARRRPGPHGSRPTARPRWFGAVLGAGFDAIVNERANRMRFPRGPRRYDIAIFAELLRLRPARTRMRLDGG